MFAPSFVTFHVGIRHINENGVWSSVIDSARPSHVCVGHAGGAHASLPLRAEGLPSHRHGQSSHSHHLMPPRGRARVLYGD
jgi:hypothetical protein